MKLFSFKAVSHQRRRRRDVSETKQSLQLRISLQHKNVCALTKETSPRQFLPGYKHFAQEDHAPVLTRRNVSTCSVTWFLK